MTIFLFLKLLNKLLFSKISEPTNDALVSVSCLIDKIKRMENGSNTAKLRNLPFIEDIMPKKSKNKKIGPPKRRYLKIPESVPAAQPPVSDLY